MITIMFAPSADCPPALRRLAGQYFHADGQLKPGGFTAFDRFLREAGRLDHELRVYDDAAALIAEVRDDRARETRLRERYDRQGKAADWKRLLKVPPYPYQRAGALFAAQAGRAIVADEMGLGKTIQAEALGEEALR